MKEIAKTTIDTSSPYYLHPSNHPSLIFVTHPLSENGDNYFTWRRSFLNALHSKNKAGFVDGTIEKPDDASSDFQAWIQCNTVVLAWLTNALAKEIQGNATHAETAREVWKDLEERFTQGIATRVYELKRAIVLLQQEKASIMREEEMVFDFLMGLDEAYTTVQSQILSIDPLPNIGRAYAIDAQEEKHRSIAASHTPTIEAAALLTKRSDSQMKGNGRGRRNQFPPCPHCGKTNHSQEYCFKVIGYPSDWRKPGKGNSLRAGHKQTNSSNAAFTAKMDGENLLIPGLTPSQQQQLMALLNGQEAPGDNPSANMARSNFLGKTENGWIVDTGATNHITQDVNSLSNVEQQHNIPPVQIPDGKTVPVHALGQITLGKRLILDQVLGVPDFCFNLITDLCTDTVEEPVMESIATEPISPDIDVGCSESDESDPTVENQQAATLPSKRQRQVSRFLSGYQYVFPPSLAPVENNTPPSSPSANSTVHPLSHFISYSKFSPNHTVFLAAISSNDELRSFSQAVNMNIGEMQ
ncbi:hypothetical protein RJ639_044640 [Escallonia herrerae]|uniref:Retrotransposon Copia-like N-terminal domain-containing protein n=1 Tax=Escallonia herrerae TaxID=1293975 RepID=A0AA88WJA0_9ASTE|nr:hypothetical protein RJ639_044640 [Escallonia herrerae]